jgi:hypothetical protein
MVDKDSGESSGHGFAGLAVAEAFGSGDGGGGGRVYEDSEAEADQQQALAGREAKGARANGVRVGRRVCSAGRGFDALRRRVMCVASAQARDARDSDEPHPGNTERVTPGERTDRGSRSRAGGLSS